MDVERCLGLYNVMKIFPSTMISEKISILWHQAVRTCVYAYT